MAVGGPLACPFVALENDRDRRSDKPDYRHRCFAEPTPQPRAITHQQAYCLSPNFPACPIFQDWAIRAAAQPLGSSPSAVVGTGVAAAAAGGAALASIEPDDVPADVPMDMPPDVAASAPEPVAAPGLTDIPPVVPAPDEPWPADAFALPEMPETAEQLSVFSAAGAPQPPPVEPLDDEPPVLEPDDELAYIAPPPGSAPAAGPPMANTDDPAVPAFLAGRQPARGRRRPAAVDAVRQPEKVRREDLIPSWELDGRFGAEPATGGGGDRFGNIVTVIAVVVILGLGVAGVIFLPGLLAGGGPSRSPTPAPTALPSGSSSLPTLVPTSTPIVTPSASPAASVGPTPTPHYYRIKSGDQLFRIARRFDVTVADILAANPEITNPDHIFVGQVIVIPPPGGSLPSAEPSSSP